MNPIYHPSLTVPPYCHAKKRMKWQDVIRLEGNRNYTLFIMTQGRRYLACRSLCVYEKASPVEFVRVHKGCMVQLLYIVSVDYYEKLLTLTDGTQVQVARRRWKRVLKTLSEFA